MSRWMPVYEEDMTHWLWDQPQRYQWWLEIRFRAATRPGVRYVGGTNIRVNVNRGEWPVTIAYLSNHWHSDDGAVKAFLEALEGDGLIECQREKLVTFIRVVGFERYCFQKPPENSQFISEVSTYTETPIDDTKVIDDVFPSGTPDDTPQQTYNPIVDETACQTVPPTLKKTSISSPDIINNKNNSDNEKEQNRELDFFYQLKNSRASLEASAMSLRCSIEKVFQLLEDFTQNIIVTEDWHKSFPGFKKHFMNWARIRITKEKSDETANKNRPFTSNSGNGGRRKGPVTPACGLNED